MQPPPYSTEDPQNFDEKAMEPEEKAGIIEPDSKAMEPEEKAGIIEPDAKADNIEQNTVSTPESKENNGGNADDTGRSAHRETPQPPHSSIVVDNVQLSLFDPANFYFCPKSEVDQSQSREGV